MEKILEVIQEMRRSRGWDKTDTLPILIKSVAVEASELLETIQWDEENVSLEEVRGELADVLMYALSICIPDSDRCRCLVTCLCKKETGLCIRGKRRKNIG